MTENERTELLARLRGDCNCGCRSGGCDRPEGCRCGSKCPCQTTLRWPEDLHAAADEIARQQDVNVANYTLSRTLSTQLFEARAEIDRLQAALNAKQTGVLKLSDEEFEENGFVL